MEETSLPACLSQPSDLGLVMLNSTNIRSLFCPKALVCCPKALVCCSCSTHLTEHEDVCAELTHPLKARAAQASQFSHLHLFLTSLFTPGGELDQIFFNVVYLGFALPVLRILFCLGLG